MTQVLATLCTTASRKGADLRCSAGYVFPVVVFASVFNPLFSNVAGPGGTKAAPARLRRAPQRQQKEQRRTWLCWLRFLCGVNFVRIQRPLFQRPKPGAKKPGPHRDGLHHRGNGGAERYTALLAPFLCGCFLSVFSQPFHRPQGLAAQRQDPHTTGVHHRGSRDRHGSAGSVFSVV